MSQQTPQIGATRKSDCGTARVVYDPTWSEKNPWKTYVNGTARNIFPTERGAVRYCESWGKSFMNSELLEYNRSLV